MTIFSLINVLFSFFQEKTKCISFSLLIKLIKLNGIQFHLLINRHQTLFPQALLHYFLCIKVFLYLLRRKFCHTVLPCAKPMSTLSNERCTAHGTQSERRLAGKLIMHMHLIRRSCRTVIFSECIPFLPDAMKRSQETITSPLPPVNCYNVKLCQSHPFKSIQSGFKEGAKSQHQLLQALQTAHIVSMSVVSPILEVILFTIHISMKENKEISVKTLFSLQGTKFLVREQNYF